MENLYKLKRGGEKRPRSREGAPQIRVAYRCGVPAFERLFSHPIDTQHRDKRDDRSLQELTSRFASLSSSVSDAAASRKHGARGDSVSLRTNLYKLDYPEDLVLYDYKIKVEPDISGVDKDTRLVLFCLFERSEELSPFLSGIVHDSSQRLVANMLLPPNLTSAIHYYEDDGGLEPQVIKKEFKFQLLGPKELRTSDLSRYPSGDDLHYCPQPIISALNLILTSYAAHTGVRTNRRGFYFYSPAAISFPECEVPPGLNLETWRGFSVTVVPTYNHLMLNVCCGSSAFYAPYCRLSDAIFAYLRRTQSMMHAASFYEGKRIITTYLGYPRRRRIKGFGSTSARKTIIYVENLEEFTVEQYFKQKYGITLEHADDLPVVNIGCKDRDVLVPAEVCQVEPGQPYNGPLLKFLDAAPALRIQKDPVNIPEEINCMLQLSGGGQAPTNFGLKLSRNPVDVPARVLPPPRLLYQSGHASISNGSWTIRGSRFLRPVRFEKPVVFVVGEEGFIDLRIELKLRLVIMTFLATCRSFGILVDTALPPLHFLDLPQTQEKHRSLPSREIDMIRQKLNLFPAKPNFLFALLPRNNLHVYSGLKMLCDIEIGIPNLCVSIPNMLTPLDRDRRFGHVAMKLNTMLGGLNHSLHPSCLQWLKNTMLVGMAVMHRTAGSSDATPSVTAVVATRDMDFVHYPASLGIQEHERWTISDVKYMMVERLKEYRRHMNDLPKRLVIFRRGVSDNQMKQLLDSEVSVVREAFGEFTGYRPKLTFIICTRGRRIQFYPMKDHKINTHDHVMAGTVVDQEITGVKDFSFFLQTHSAPQNTTRATRYTVIIDENKFGADTLQQGINDLSYLWPLAPRALSMAPPAYWAGRACQRARLYVHEMMEEIQRRGCEIDGKDILEKVKELWGEGVHDNVKRTMFYY